MKKEKSISIISAINLLARCLESGLILRDPNDTSHILVYRTSGTDMPEGWYSEDILRAATELSCSPEGISYLEGMLRKVEEKNLE